MNIKIHANELATVHPKFCKITKIYYVTANEVKFEINKNTGSNKKKDQSNFLRGDQLLDHPRDKQHIHLHNNHRPTYGPA